MAIFKLKSEYKPTGDQPRAIKSLVRGIEKGFRYQTLLGVTGSGKTFTMANVISNFNKPVLVIAPNKTLAAQLYREYKNFFPENSVNYFVSYYDYYQPEAYLPITDTYISKEAMINEEIDKLRHRATSALMSRRDVIIVASVSCIYNLGIPLNYLEASLYLEIGKPITRGDLIRQLVKMQFRRTPGALKKGHFRVRGDSFDIMPASGGGEARSGRPASGGGEARSGRPASGGGEARSGRPASGEVNYYIKIADQRVQSISFTDPMTRKIIEKLNEIVIFPPKHFISTEPQRDLALKDIKRELKERLEYFSKKNLYLEAERLRRRTLYDVEMIKTIGYCHGVENYSRHLTGKLAGEPSDTLLSYFAHKNSKTDFITIIDESHVSLPQIRGMYEGDRNRKKALVEHGWRLPSALDNRPLKFGEFEKRIGQTIFTSATPGPRELKHSKQIVEQIIRPTGLIDPVVEVRPVFNRQKNLSQIDDVIGELKKTISKKERAIINVLTKAMAEDLTDFLSKQSFRVNYMHSDIKTLDRVKILTNFRKGEFDVLVGVNLLREGLDLPEVTLVAILDADREGFLRSETSLMQTMGRTARNVRGKVFLYANELTGSIKRALKEVERRRKIQLEYNKKHKIIPKSIKKKVEELIDLSNYGK